MLPLGSTISIQGAIRLWGGAWWGWEGLPCFSSCGRDVWASAQGVSQMQGLPSPLRKGSGLVGGGCPIAPLGPPPFSQVTSSHTLSPWASAPNPLPWKRHQRFPSRSPAIAGLAPARRRWSSQNSSSLRSRRLLSIYSRQRASILNTHRRKELLIPISEKRKLRLRKAKSLAQGHI